MAPQHLSVGFADMDNFKGLVKHLGWEEVVKTLQSSFEALGEMIVSHEGQIHKYMGDAILFTCPDPRQAVEIAQAIAAYRLPLAEQTVRFYVAVATGPVIVTKLGHVSHQVEDIFGEPVMQAIQLINRARADETGWTCCAETQRFLD